jgi:fatty acid desaturase
VKRVLALGLGDATPGVGIVRASVVTSLTYALAVGWDAAGLAGGNTAAVAVALALFVGAMVVWIMAFGRAVVRSTRGDEIQVASLFFLQTSAPRAVRARLLGIAAFVVVLTVVTLATNPVGFLVNMLPIGFAGLWGARHGTYPERTDPRYTGRTDGRYRQRAHQNRRPR